MAAELDNPQAGKLYIGVDPRADGLGAAVVFDGQVYQFLGYTSDDGVVIGDPVEAWYLDPDGNRVDVPAVVDLWPSPGTLVTSFTVPLRHAGRMPALDDARPRCSKCSAVLDPCDQCGGPAQCGETICAEHQPDGEDHDRGMDHRS